MSYSVIQPPFSFEFRKMPNAELKEYGAWFQRVLPERIGTLAGEIQRMPGFESWQPDYSPESFWAIEEWFRAQVESRPFTSKDREALADALAPGLAEGPESTLTNRTFSLAMDLGMYLGEVIIRNNPGARWEQILRGSRRNIDYGQPVVDGIGKVPMNPIRLMVVAAFGAAEGKPPEFKHIYDVWTGKVPPRKLRW